MRTGIIAKKIGMSNLFTPNGVNIPITVLQVDECKVIERIEINDSDNDKITLGAFELKKANNANKGFFDKKKTKPYRLMKEFFVEKSDQVKSGDNITVDHFKEGQFIDISGISKGKGFSGVMKRHNFSGLRASHGVSAAHRSAGSTGQCQDPGKVFKGKKMAGQYGSTHKTSQNLQVVKIDPVKKIICLKGSTPGSRGSWLIIEDSVKQKEAKEIDVVISAPKDKSNKKEQKEAQEKKEEQ
tara:strand:- start:938 stop:1660 length:723 start_codon:yes stop_codon:yes gene_type:complete